MFRRETFDPQICSQCHKNLQILLSYMRDCQAGGRAGRLLIGGSVVRSCKILNPTLLPMTVPSVCERTHEWLSTEMLEGVLDEKRCIAPDEQVSTLTR